MIARKLRAFFFLALWILEYSLKPFLKWLGNKYRSLKYLQPFLPAGERLIEPFTGSAAIFLNTSYSNYLLGEQNIDLINLYQYLKNEGEDFIRYCRKYFAPKYNCEATYYQLRKQFNVTRNKKLKAALFLYLNRHGYNGLCRYNGSGGFNVPFGRYQKPYFPAQEMLHFYHKAQTAAFIHADFRETLANAGSGDIIYCDPPYVPLSASANFTNYTHLKFGEEEQLQLVAHAQRLANQGAHVVISNHDTPITRHYYRDAQLHSVMIPRTISCKGAQREAVKELIAIF